MSKNDISTIKKYLIVQVEGDRQAIYDSLCEKDFKGFLQRNGGEVYE